MQLKEEFKEKIKLFLKTDEKAIAEDEYYCSILYDNSRGTYIMYHVLCDIYQNCDLSDLDTKDLVKILKEFSTDLFDIESIVWYMEKYESLVNELLPGSLFFGYSENGDYGIFLLEEGL